MKSSETIGVFCENNTKHTRVHTVLGEMQSFLMLQQMEHVVATGLHMVRLRFKCDGTRPETRFRLSAKQTSPFKRQGLQFSRLMAAELRASAVVMLDTPCSGVVCRVLATHSIRQFPLHPPSRAAMCAITFQLDSTTRHYLTWTYML